MKFKGLIGVIVLYPVELLKWFVKGRFHNATILISILTIFYLVGKLSFEPKIVSIIFLIVGLAIIIWQMIVDSKRFSDQGPNTFKNWIMKIPRFKPKNLKINVSSTAVATIGAKAHIKVSISENTSLEEKVEFLLKRKEEIENAINSLDDKLDTKISEMNKKMREVESKIEEVNKIINATISDITIGNYDLRLFSIILMICGTFLQILN